eukprot:471303_1
MTANYAYRIEQNDDYNSSNAVKKSCCGKIKNKVLPHTSQQYNESIETSLHSKTLESVEEGTEQKISISKAKLHRYLTTPNWGPKKKFAPYSVYNFPLALFNDYGVGTKLYFEFIVKLLYLCLFISIFYIPIYYILYSANKFNTSSSFEQLSLGNLGDFNSTTMTTTAEIINAPFIGISLNYRLINQYIAYTDFICILLLLLFIIWFESTLKLKEKEYDDMTKTIGDFSIEVLNLPLNVSSRRSLANFFEDKWGQVIDVSICYNDGHIIKKYQKHSKIINQFNRHKVLYSKATKSSTRAKETNKLQRLQTKLDKSSFKMLEFAQQFNHGDKHCVKAYITFENEPERNNCLREYHRHQLKYFCRKNPRFVYQDHELTICEAPEPSNILYLNHGYTKCNLFCRRFSTTILSTLMLIGSFCLILTAHFFKNSSIIDT